MKIIGLTGGIGSGKSTVARFFQNWGIPVYFADDAAKEVMESAPIQKALSEAFGAGIMLNGRLNRKLLAEIVFNDPQKLAILNNIVHPAVKIHFKEWLLLQQSEFVIREAAILFESGSYADCDAIIIVTAPTELRIRRVMDRDDVTREQVLKRIDSQWTDEQRIAKSNYLITNIELSDTERQTQKIYNELMNR